MGAALSFSIDFNRELAALYRFQWRAPIAPLFVPIFWMSQNSIEINGVFNSGSIWDKQVFLRAWKLALFREWTHQALAAFSLFPFFFRLFEALHSTFQWIARAALSFSIGFNGELASLYRFQWRALTAPLSVPIFWMSHKPIEINGVFNSGSIWDKQVFFWELAS